MTLKDYIEIDLNKYYRNMGVVMVDASSTLREVEDALLALAKQVLATISDERSFMEVYGWNMPALDRHEFADIFKSPILLINQINGVDFSDVDLQKLQKYPIRIRTFQSGSLPQLPGGHAFYVYTTAISLIAGLNAILEQYLPPKLEIKALEDKNLLPAAQIKRLRSVENHIDKVTAEAGDLADRKSVV